jgi:hypothetical protein
VVYIRAQRTYTQLTYNNFTSILSDTDKSPNNPKLKEVINSKLKEVGILLKLK